jgi:Domain of unknown function (DUF4145)
VLSSSAKRRITKMSKPDVAIHHIDQPSHAYPICHADVLCSSCGYYSASAGPVVGKQYALVECKRCGEATMIQAENLDNRALAEHPVIDYYPKRKPAVDPFVPKDIAEDFLEAQRCFMVGAWHGCAVMARRCMHSVAEHFKATGKDLYEQIENLKNAQIITPVLAEQAQHVRVLGKHGAHPYDMKGNELKDLGVGDAQSALEFCEFIFDQVFVQPEKIKASKTRLSSP